MAIVVGPEFYDTDRHRGIAQSAQIAVSTTPTRLLDDNPARLGVVITNAGASTVFVSGSPTTNANDGHALLAGGSLSLSSSTALYGVTASGTVIVTILEETVR